MALLLLFALSLLLHAVLSLFTESKPAIRLFFAGVTRIMGLRIVVRGERVAGDAFLLANHISWLDIPALGRVYGAAFVAHDGLAAFAWLKWLCRLNDTVFVARRDRRSVARQVEQVREAIRDTGALAIFPEGTTGPGDEIMPFKSALLSALTPLPDGLSVQPVWLDYGTDTAEIAWVGEETGRDNFVRLAARRAPVMLTIHLLAPLAGEALADRKSIAAAAHGAIVAAKTQHGRDHRVAL